MILDCHPTLKPFTFPTSEKPTRHGEVLHFHISGSNNSEKVPGDMPLLSNSVDLQAITNELVSQKVTSSLFHPNGELYSQQPLGVFIGNLAQDSKITIYPDGRVEFTGSGSDVKDLLSMVAEFYLSRNSTNWRTQSLLVPHFNR